MRTITIPAAVIERAAHGPITGGACIEIAVAVDWPELQLTEDQIMANAIACANGQRDPYPNQSIFTVSVPFIKSAARASQEKPA